MRNFGKYLPALFLLGSLACSKKEEPHPGAAKDSGPLIPPPSLLRSGDSGTTVTAVQRLPSAPEALQPLIKNVESRTYALKFFGSLPDRSVGFSAVPAVLEIMRGSQMALIEPLLPDEVAILRRLTGQKLLKTDWEGWMEWWWGQGARATHAGYPFLKRHLYGRMSPTLRAVLNPEFPSTVDLTEIIPRPGLATFNVPALNDPKTLPQKSPDTDYMVSSDLVLGLEVAGRLRAYPLRLLNYHEIVNDTLGGEPIVVTFDPLTRAAYAFKARTKNGGPRRFRFTGLLYRADSLIADEATNSLWSSRLGTPIMGPLSGSGESLRLEPIPVVLTTWYVWRHTYHDSTTLSLDTGYDINYGHADPYEAYYQSPDPMLPLMRRDDRLPLKEPIFGLEINGEAVAFAYSRIKNLAMVYDIIGGEIIGILCFPERHEFRAYRIGDRLLHLTASPTQLQDFETQRLWEIRESSLDFGMDNSAHLSLDRLNGDVTFWYAWQMWHPKTRIYEPPPKKPDDAIPMTVKKS